MDAGRALMTRELRSLTHHSESFARIIATILTVLGDHDRAVDALQDSVRLGKSHFLYRSRGETALAPLRTHPRFRQLLDVVRERWERGGASAEDHA